MLFKKAYLFNTRVGALEELRVKLPLINAKNTGTISIEDAMVIYQMNGPQIELIDFVCNKTGKILFSNEYTAESLVGGIVHNFNRDHSVHQWRRRKPQ